MNNFEKINADFFNSNCEKYKLNWQACGYVDEFMQDVYYHSIFKNVNKKFESVLDIGCGQGDLLNFIRRNACKAQYTGIDVSSKMIDKCSRLYTSGSFYNKSFLEYEDKTFDIILSVGAFNLRVSKDDAKQLDYLKLNIKKMYDNCEMGCFLTLLSKYGNQNIEDELFYYEPTKLMEFCLNLTSAVAIDHASIPFEFIVALHKE